MWSPQVKMNGPAVCKSCMEKTTEKQTWILENESHGVSCTYTLFSLFFVKPVSKGFKAQFTLGVLNDNLGS